MNYIRISNFSHFTDKRTTEKPFDPTIPIGNVLVSLLFFSSRYSIEWGDCDWLRRQVDISNILLIELN